MATEKQELEKREQATPVAVEPTPTRRVLTPGADVYETEDGLVVVADMPGVDERSVDINVERNVLTIEGRVEPEELADYQLIYREYEPGDYRRAFILSDEVDVGKIEASVKHGVLRIDLPKAEATKPRQIAVKTGT